MWEKVERTAKVVGLITGIGAILSFISYNKVSVFLTVFLSAAFALIGLILYGTWLGAIKFYNYMKKSEKIT